MYKFNFQFPPKMKVTAEQVAALQVNWPYEFFTHKELACKCGCGGVPQDKFIRCLEQLRKDYNKPIVISSGYRCKKHNLIIGGVMESAHTQGLAADIKISGKNAHELLKHAFSLGFTGIGIQQKGFPTSRYIHLDIAMGLLRPNIWSY